MFKLINILLLLSLSSFCVSKNERAKSVVGSAYNAMLITENTNKRSTDGNEHSLLKYVYINNTAGDSLAVYVLDGGALSVATVFTINKSSNGLSLKIQPLNGSQDSPESLLLTFNDADHSVGIKGDHYTLYPAFYTSFKQQVQIKHSVMAVLGLIQDKIGDYPIDYLFPLTLYASRTSTDMRVQRAKVTTARTQAEDTKDTWNCTFHYNKSGKLDLIKASNSEETRFTKRLTYMGDKVKTIRYDTNLEERQTVNRTVTYSSANTSSLKWLDKVYEPGKDRETSITATVAKRNINQVKSINLNQAQVLSLIK